MAQRASRREQAERARSHVTGQTAYGKSPAPYTTTTTPAKPQAVTRAAPEYVRDVLTGAKIPVADVPHLLVMRVRDRDMREERHPLDGGLLARTPVPSTIDSREQYPEGHLGGRQWTAPFTRYIAKVLPLAVAAERDDWRYWWRVPYVVARLRVHMGEERFAVAMARLASGLRLDVVERGGLLYEADIAGTCVRVHFRRREREWVVGCERQARRLVRARYFPYERRPRRDVREGLAQA